MQRDTWFTVDLSSALSVGLLLICYLPCQGLVDVHIMGNSSATWCSYFLVVTKVLPPIRLKLQAYSATGGNLAMPLFSLLITRPLPEGVDTAGLPPVCATAPCCPLMLNVQLF